MAQLVIQTVTGAIDPAPQEGDTHHAWNDRHIWRTHAQHIVKPTNMNNFQDLGGLLYKWFCKTCRYRFERRGRNTVICIDMQNADAEIDVSATMHIKLYLDRRKAKKRKPLWCLKSNGIFQSKREIWFSPATSFDKATIESFWDVELANDGKDKNDYKYLDIGSASNTYAFAVPTTDFADADREPYEEQNQKPYSDCTADEKQAFIDSQGFGAVTPPDITPVTLQHRIREIPLDTLSLTKVSVDDLKDMNKGVDVMTILNEEDDIDLSKVTLLKDKAK